MVDMIVAFHSFPQTPNKKSDRAFIAYGEIFYTKRRSAIGNWECSDAKLELLTWKEIS
jgi:hypothetical protein